MKDSYTYQDWLDGVDDISANRSLFGLVEWAKVRAKQADIFKEEIQKRFFILKAEFEDALETHNRDSLIDVYLDEFDLLMHYQQDDYMEPDIPKDLLKYSRYFNSGGDVSIDYGEVKKPEVPTSNSFNDNVYAAAYKEFRDYLYGLRDENTSAPRTERKDPFTLNQKMLIIYALSELGILKLNSIHQDQKKQAKLLSALIWKSSDNTYDALREITKENHQDSYITRRNLKAVLPVLENIDDCGPKAELLNRLNTIVKK